MESKNKVEQFIQKHPHWEKALLTFREILRHTELEETIKWGMPVYTLNGKNVDGGIQKLCGAVVLSGCLY